MKRPLFTPEELATFDSEADAQRRRDMEIRWYGFSIAHLPPIAAATGVSIDELVRRKEVEA